MGWVVIVGHTKKQFQTTNLFEVNSKLEFLKTKHLTNVKFQNVLMDLKVSGKKKSLYFFQCLLESLCPFKKEI